MSQAQVIPILTGHHLQCRLTAQQTVTALQKFSHTHISDESFTNSILYALEFLENAQKSLNNKLRDHNSDLAAINRAMKFAMRHLEVGEENQFEKLQHFRVLLSYIWNERKIPARPDASLLDDLVTFFSIIRDMTPSDALPVN